MIFHDAIDRYNFERELRDLPQQDLIEQLGIYDVLKRQEQLFLKDLLYSTSLHQATMINLVVLKNGRYVVEFAKISTVKFISDKGSNKVLMLVEDCDKVYVLGEDAFSTIGNAKAEARRRNEQLNLYPTRPVSFSKEDPQPVCRNGEDEMDDVLCPRCGAILGSNETFYDDMRGKTHIYCMECGQKITMKE